MANFTISRSDLLDHLQQQSYFIRNSAAAFDSGFRGEAKRIAVAVRILLHQTANSHSLLGQLGWRQRDFYDTAGPYDSRNLLTTQSLVAYRISNEGASCYAPLDEFVSHATWTKFRLWWETAILADNKKRTISRRQLVLTMSNQDGGAHVDPQLNEVYADLVKKNSMNWVFQSQSGNQTPVFDIELCSMRQIGHEVIKTLDAISAA